MKHNNIRKNAKNPLFTVCEKGVRLSPPPPIFVRKYEHLEKVGGWLEVKQPPWFR